MTSLGLDSKHRAALVFAGLMILVVAAVAFFTIPGIGLILSTPGLVLIVVAVAAKGVAPPSG